MLKREINGFQHCIRNPIEAEKKLIVRRTYLKTVIFKRKIMGGWESTGISRLDLKKLWRQQWRNSHLKLSSRAL